MERMLRVAPSAARGGAGQSGDGILARGRKAEHTLLEHLVLNQLAIRHCLGMLRSTRPAASRRGVPRPDDPGRHEIDPCHPFHPCDPYAPSTEGPVLVNAQR